MRSLILLMCLTLGCLAQRPQQCESPPLLTGSFSVSTPSEKLMAYARYTYDALRKRVHLKEFGAYENKTFHIEALLLFKEGVMFKINRRNRTCCKRPLHRDFHPLQIPKNATLMGHVVLGASSGPGQGLLVNTWAGEMELKRRGSVKYMSTVTEFGCVPVSTLFYTDKTGWVVTSFFNNVLGIADPELLIPPSFCKEAQLDENDAGEPADFYSFFF